jgi:hypothetical protein
MSPVFAVITYNLLDILRIIVVYERRHLLQIGRLVASAGFPS